MKPFRFAYVIFNPSRIAAAFKETRTAHDRSTDFSRQSTTGPRNTPITDYFVVVELSTGHKIEFRAIDELEQEGNLQSFLLAWNQALSEWMSL